MRRWVGLGVIADNIIQMVAAWHCHGPEVPTDMTRNAKRASAGNQNMQGESDGL